MSTYTISIQLYYLQQTKSIILIVINARATDHRTVFGEAVTSAIIHEWRM